MSKVKHKDPVKVPDTASGGLGYDRASQPGKDTLFETIPAEQAPQVIVLRWDEARALERDYIGTEHILLGLLREEEGARGTGARVASTSR